MNTISDIEIGIPIQDTLRKREDFTFIQPNPSQSTSEQIPDSHVTVQEATGISGYSAQYLRRLLRAGKLEGSRKGQTWRINQASLITYLYTAISSNDLRYGPHKAWQPPF